MQPASTDRGVHQASGALHAQFHREAANVLRLVSSGDIAGATAAIEPGGSFAEVSRHLTKTMIEWRRLTSQVPA